MCMPWTTDFWLVLYIMSILHMHILFPHMSIHMSTHRANSMSNTHVCTHVHTHVDIQGHPYTSVHMSTHISTHRANTKYDRKLNAFSQWRRQQMWLRQRLVFIDALLAELRITFRAFFRLRDDAVHSRFSPTPWPMHGPYMAGTMPVHGPNMVHTWPMHGPCMAQTWPTHGPYMVHTWPIHGPHMVRTWPTHGPHMARTWSIHGPYMARTWPIHGPYMAHTWPIHGPYMARTWPVHGPYVAIRGFRRRDGGYRTYGGVDVYGWQLDICVKHDRESRSVPWGLPQPWPNHRIATDVFKRKG